MAQKENQRIALTKKLLQEGLLRLLEVKTLDKISVTELCRESGINRATFYNHYTSPQDLLTDVEKRMTAELQKALNEPRSAMDALRETEAVCNFFADHAQTILILHRCHADDSIADVLYTLNENFQSFRATSNFARTLDQDGIYLVSVFFHTGTYHVLLEWIRTGMKKSPREVAELMIRLAAENFLD